MKKGILVILGLFVLGLVAGAIYTQKDVDVRQYEKIILKNEYGEFDIPLKMIIVQQKKTISTTLVCDKTDVEFKIIPSHVSTAALLQEEPLYYFKAVLIDARSKSLREGRVFLVDNVGTRIAAPRLEIRTKSSESKKLKDWQLLLRKAYDFQFPVVVKGEITNIVYAGPDSMRYILIIDICNVSR